jgi:hypothetical protein
MGCYPYSHRDRQGCWWMIEWTSDCLMKIASMIASISPAVVAAADTIQGTDTTGTPLGGRRIAVC